MVKLRVIVRVGATMEGTQVTGGVIYCRSHWEHALYLL